MRENSSHARKAGVVLLVGNILLACLKFAGWKYTGSIALRADAFNSLVDAAYSSIIFVGLLIATIQETESYPEGLKRVEPFLSLFIAGGILITSVKLIQESVFALQTPSAITHYPVAISVLLVSVLAKYYLYRYCVRIGQQYDYPSIVAAGVENKNDVLTSLVAIVGIIAFSLGLQWGDAIAGVIVAVAIGYSGIEILRENLGYILGRSPSQEEIRAIKKVALNHNEIHGLHDVEIHYSGPTVDISMHLEVEGGLTIEEGHQIERAVADAVREESSEPVNEINLHIDPKPLGEWSDD